MDQLLTGDDVAAYLKVAEITLRKWRLNGSGPKFIRVGSKVRYRMADVQTWVSDHTFSSTSGY